MFLSLFLLIGVLIGIRAGASVVATRRKAPLNNGVPVPWWCHNETVLGSGKPAPIRRLAAKVALRVAGRLGPPVFRYSLKRMVAIGTRSSRWHAPWASLPT